MQKLTSEIARLYLPSITDDGMTRAMVIPFRKMADGDEARHWTLLCSVANALQHELGLPAPAVSISGADGYQLWLSLATPTPAAVARQFLALLRDAYFPGADLELDAPVELPPCMNQSSGKWAAFIHPGLGASFADESGLEMAPPEAGQAALLEGLHSISEAQFMHAMKVLQPSQEAAPLVERAATPQGLLLKDATLEDIVRHLHAKHIEPTFRHLIGK